MAKAIKQMIQNAIWPLIWRSDLYLQKWCWAISDVAIIYPKEPGEQFIAKLCVTYINSFGIYKSLHVLKPPLARISQHLLKHF